MSTKLTPLSSRPQNAQLREHLQAESEAAVRRRESQHLASALISGLQIPPHDTTLVCLLGGRHCCTNRDAVGNWVYLQPELECVGGDADHGESRRRTFATLRDRLERLLIDHFGHCGGH